MDYLYINAIVKETYQDVPCGCEFPDAYRKSLFHHISVDDCMQENAPAKVVTYFSIKEKGHAPLLVLANTEKQKSCASVGRLAQFLGWEWDGTLINEDMDSIFCSRFYSEEEVLTKVKENVLVPLPQSRRSDGQAPVIRLDFETKKAILTAVFSRWLRHDAVLRIAVPKNVDYSDYVWQAVKQIYAIFPAALRVEAGFCSYLPSVERAPSRVYIGFIPEDMADPKTLALDGSRRSAITALEKGTHRELLDRFIEFLCGVNPDTCHDFLEEVYEDLEGGGDGARIAAVGPTDYQVMGEAVSLLTAQGDLESLIPKWRDFYDNLKNYTPKMRRRIHEGIQNQIDPEAFCRLFRKNCSGKKTPEEILKVLKSYQVFFQKNLPLADALWDTAVALMRENGTGYQNIHNCAVAAMENLSPAISQDKIDNLFRLTMEERLDGLKIRQVQSIADTELLIVEAKNLRGEITRARETVCTAALLESVDSAISEWNSKRNDFLWADFAAQFEAVKNMPAGSMAELKAVIGKAQKLLEKIANEQQTEKLTKLKAEAQKYLDLQNEKINHSDIKLNRLLEIIADGNDYFTILNQLDQADKQLESNQLETMYGELQKKRPATIEQYEALFQKSFQSEFVLASIARLPAYVCWRVVLDICAFNVIPVAYSKAGSLADLDGAAHIARKISNTCAVEVLFQQGHWDAAWFRKMLTMSHTRKSLGNSNDFEKVFYALVDCGTFTGADLPSCIQMLNECDLYFRDLLKRILEGKIKNCTEQQYIEAFEQIYQYSIQKDKDFKLKSMENVCKNVGNDGVAVRAFHKFAQTKQEKKHVNLKLLIPILIGVAILVLALILALILIPKKRKAVPPTRTTVSQIHTEPAPTETTPIEYPADLQLLRIDGEAVERLYGGNPMSFTSYSGMVSEALNGLDSDQICEAYTEEQEEFVSIDQDDTKVTWDEYFFWVCWAYADTAYDADTGTYQVFSLNDYHEKACSILRAIYYNLPAGPVEQALDELNETNSTITETAAAETTTAIEAETAFTSETAETEFTEAAGEIAVATESAMGTSVEEILASISSAAEANYTTAAANAHPLRMVLALFGREYTKEFDEHQALVESMLCAAGEHALTITSRYRGLPEDSIVVFPEDDIRVSWSEYVFWECWLMSRNDLMENADDTELHAEVLEILRIIHNLPEVNTEHAEASVEEIAKTTQPSTDQNETTPTEVNGMEESLPVEMDPSAGMSPRIATAEARVAFENAREAYKQVLNSICVG